MRNEDIYKAEEIKPGVYRIEEYGVYCYLVVGSMRALLIDTGTGFGNLAEFTGGICSKPLDVAATHAHPDHIGGRGSFQTLYLPTGDGKIARLYGTLFVRRLMFGKKARQTYGKKRRDILRGRYRTRYLPLSDGDSFELGGRTVRCIQIPGHTRGGMMFALEEDRLLFTGDNLCPALWMFLPGATSVEKWISGANRALALMAEYTAYSGHDQNPQSAALVEKMIATANELVKTHKNTFFPNIRVYPKDYTDHGILYRTSNVRSKKRDRR